MRPCTSVFVPLQQPDSRTRSRMRRVSHNDHVASVRNNLNRYAVLTHWFAGRPPPAAGFVDVWVGWLGMSVVAGLLGRARAQAALQTPLRHLLLQHWAFLEQTAFVPPHTPPHALVSNWQFAVHLSVPAKKPCFWHVLPMRSAGSAGSHFSPVSTTKLPHSGGHVGARHVRRARLAPVVHDEQQLVSAVHPMPWPCPRHGGQSA